MEQCCLCTVEIAAGTPVTEFPCHHKAHVPCVFRTAVNHGFGIECSLCNTLIVPMEVFDEIIGARGGRDAVDTEQVKNIQDVLMKDTDFKKDAKVFKGAVRELRSARRAFKLKMSVTRTKFHREIDGFIFAISQIRQRYIKDVKEFDEYKRLGQAQRRISYYLTRLSRKWHINTHNIYRGIVNKDDYWSMFQWLNSAPQLIRNAMRVRGFYH